MISKIPYKFHNPGYIKIKKRVSEQSDIIRTLTDTWQWEDCGNLAKIEWLQLNLCSELREILKGFIYHRLSIVSLSTVGKQDLQMLKFLSKQGFGINFPWVKEKVIEIVNITTKENRSDYFGFKGLYKWAVINHIPNFEKEIYECIDEIKPPQRKPYANVFLNPEYLSIEDENSILEYINNFDDFKSYISFRHRVLLQLAYELAPRASQIYALNKTDLEKVKNPKSNETYYCLWLPMAKKIRSTEVERRPRKITQKLGERIEQLIIQNPTNGEALFQDPLSGRLSSSEITTGVAEILGILNLSVKGDLTLMRHHLAQSLADQGASAEVIAEILGHNSTLPARAYIASTPEIAKIKTRALGKNSTYEKINKMLLTGEIIDKKDASQERWVKGMIGSQYIGGIGSCGLAENTACPKNPVYSCYTCSKFHPFRDGVHEEVKTGLQKHAQYFIDVAQKGLNLETNRPVIQLERTIEAVNEVIKRTNTHE